VLGDLIEGHVIQHEGDHGIHCARRPIAPGLFRGDSVTAACLPRGEGSAAGFNALMAAADRWSRSDVLEIERAIRAARARGSTSAVPTMERPARAHPGTMMIGAVVSWPAASDMALPSSTSTGAAPTRLATGPHRAWTKDRIRPPCVAARELERHAASVDHLIRSRQQ
jgi:hypothetical protein